MQIMLAKTVTYNFQSTLGSGLNPIPHGIDFGIIKASVYGFRGAVAPVIHYIIMGVSPLPHDPPLYSNTSVASTCQIRILHIA